MTVVALIAIGSFCAAGSTTGSLSPWSLPILMSQPVGTEDSVTTHPAVHSWIARRSPRLSHGVRLVPLFFDGTLHAWLWTVSGQVLRPGSTHAQMPPVAAHWHATWD